jgi:hypothetical protein
MSNPHGRKPLDPFHYEERLAIPLAGNAANKGKMPLLEAIRKAILGGQNKEKSGGELGRKILGKAKISP